MVLTAAVLFLPTGIPVDPDAPHARQWLIDELAKPEYQAAKPTWFDLVSQAIKDWLASLHVPGAAGDGNLFLIIAAVIVLAIVVTAFLVFGVPRLSRRAPAAGVFEDDGRSADDLREAAKAAAAKGDWSAALLDRFRAVALSLRERAVVPILPGTTAHEVAERAAPVFPAHAEELRAAAASFDGVRYLGRSATRAAHDRVSALDDDLRRARPSIGHRDAASTDAHGPALNGPGGASEAGDAWARIGAP